MRLMQKVGGYELIMFVYLLITVSVSLISFVYSTGCDFDEQPKYSSYKEYIETVIRKIDCAITIKGKIIYALFLAIFVIGNFAGITASGICNLVTDFIHNNFDFNSKEKYNDY